MLRENNSYSNFIRYTAGREASLADKSIRQESNLMLACTSAVKVSDPVGYNYQYAITMPRSTSMLIAAIMRGNGIFTASAYTRELLSATFSGVGTMTADMVTKESLTATMQGEGTFTGSAFAYEVLSAIFDSGSRPSASDIAWETWMFKVATVSDPLSAAYKLNSGGSSLTDIANAVWTKTIEGNLTAQELLRIMSSIQAGKTSITDLGNSTAQVTFRDLNDTKDRIVADMTNSDRTKITLDPS